MQSPCSTMPLFENMMNSQYNGALQCQFRWYMTKSMRVATVGVFWDIIAYNCILGNGKWDIRHATPHSGGDLWADSAGHIDDLEDGFYRLSHEQPPEECLVVMRVMRALWKRADMRLASWNLRHPHPMPCDCVACSRADLNTNFSISNKHKHKEKNGVVSIPIELYFSIYDTSTQMEIRPGTMRTAAWHIAFNWMALKNAIDRFCTRCSSCGDDWVLNETHFNWMNSNTLTKNLFKVITNDSISTGNSTTYYTFCSMKQWSPGSRILHLVVWCYYIGLLLLRFWDIEIPDMTLDYIASSKMTTTASLQVA